MSSPIQNEERQMIPKYIGLKVSDQMYELIAAESDRRDIPMNQAVVEILGEWFKSPEAAFVPRARIGRPRAKQKVSSNGKRSA